MLARLGKRIYGSRWLVLCTALAFVAVAAIYGTGVFGSLKSGGGFTDPASESTKAQSLIDTQFPNSSTDVIILMKSDTLKATDPAFVTAATHLLTTLQTRQEVNAVTSYYSTGNTIFLSRDRHETFARVHLVGKHEATKEHNYKVIQPLITSSTLQILVGGVIPANVAISDQVHVDLGLAEGITLPIVAILLLIIFRGLVAASLPLLVGGVAILGAFAILRLLASLTAVSVFAIPTVTILGLGLSIDYSLFIITRFREELALNETDVSGALQRTMSTAGRTILFSGLIVSTSLLGLLLFPLFFLRSTGMGAIATTLVALLAALTILPVILALLGRRVNALSLQGLFKRNRNSSVQPKESSAESHRTWTRLSQIGLRWPGPVALSVVAILVLLVLPFLHASFTNLDVRVVPPDQPAHIVSDRLSQDFASQGSSQLEIAISTPGDALTSTNLSSLSTYVHTISAIPGVIHVDSLVTVNSSLSLADYQQLYAHPGTNPQLAGVVAQLANGDATQVFVAMQPIERSTAAQRIVRQIRAIEAPGGLVPRVDGTTPEQMDQLASLGATLPWTLSVIAVTTLILLFLMTGSLLMPLKAIFLNTLSLSATFGALVWIFQDGHLQNVLHFHPIGGLDSTQPILIFAVAFGLSMDYEVFLLSRIKEQFDATGDNRAAVAMGLQRTAWLISCAALLLTIVVGAFASSKIILVQELGVGLAIAIIMDATLIRMLLVPATMCFLGKWNWWAPAPLHALWQRIGLSETATSTAETGTPPSRLLEDVPTQTSIEYK